jgi:hypothetical protein
MLAVILIGLEILQTASSDFSRRLSLLGKARSNLLFPAPLPRLSILPCPLLLVRYFGCIGYFLTWVSLYLTPLLCIVTTKVLFRLLTI